MDTLDGTTEQLQAVAGQLDTIAALSGKAGGSISAAFAGGIAGGRSFDAVLRGVGQRLEKLALQAAFRPLEGLALGGLDTMLSGLTGVVGAAGPAVTPFADGGVLAAPSYFPLAGGLGLAGEAGPEAILPLARGADGRLGVRAGGDGGRAVAVTVTIATPDAESFRRSEAQVSAAIARAVARGRRAS